MVSEYEKIYGDIEKIGARTSANTPWIITIPKLNVTVKWTGNNKEFCRIVFIILQMLIFLLLCNKVSNLKMQVVDIQKNSTLGKTKPRSSFRVISNDNSSTTRIKHIPSTTSPITECVQIDASSELEYVLKTENLSKPNTICLTINFEQKSHWNLKHSLQKAEMVKEIIFMGYVDMMRLYVMLKKFNKICKLTIDQKNLHKDWGHRYLLTNYRTKVNLLNLTEIVLQNIHYAQVFEFLAKAFYMNGLKILKIGTIDIDQDNIMGIRQLLKQCKYSLEVLHFSDVLWKVALFDSFSYAVPNLVELQIDFVSPADERIEFLRGFQAAERLTTIVSMQGYLPYDQFFSIFDFKLITSLVLGVEIFDNVTSLDSLFPIDNLPKLDYIELFLHFNNITKCYMLLENDIETSYETRLHSNCDVE